jgi:hypothetical protein
MVVLVGNLITGTCRRCSVAKKEDGSMFAEVALVAGKSYQYRYLLNDGRWVNDNTIHT